MYLAVRRAHTPNIPIGQHSGLDLARISTFFKDAWSTRMVDTLGCFNTSMKNITQLFQLFSYLHTKRNYDNSYRFDIRENSSS